MMNHYEWTDPATSVRYRVEKNFGSARSREIFRLRAVIDDTLAAMEQAARAAEQEFPVAAAGLRQAAAQLRARLER